ncbi:hypothetical protein MTR67_042516 [Solanum verrucosum]|uniref:SWIM-type domain-containing protein n=1 Tax=Solanum verrucosum TaxID=315347 RepID=A0AAF0UPH5_SOLVR|nr:hypothetical protein MTR67_042516 [Solanum verrucosum]
MHDGSFLLSPIVNEGTDCSESEDDSNNVMVFSCSDYDTDELENFVTKQKRNITDSLQDYKEIVKGMDFKDIAEAKQFCKLYALAKKVELVVVKNDKKKIELNVSVAKCKRAKKEVLESLEGSFVDSYNKLEGYATELRSCNTGSDIVIDLSKEALSNGNRKFLRMYICFKAMKLDFKSGLRPLIGLDGTFLKGKTKGQAVDNNFTESFNAWILEARYKPIIGMLEDIRVKTMERLAAKKVDVRKWKDDGFSPKSELLFIQYLKLFNVCKVSGNGNNGYEVTEGADRHIVNLRKKKCTCRTCDLTEIPCPHAIKAMKHKKMIPKKEIHWYYSKEATLTVYKHKLQPVRGEPF